VSTSVDFTNPDQAANHRRGLLWLLVTAVGWGFNWPMMRMVLNELPPFTVRALTCTAGAAVAFATAALLGERLRPPPSQWQPLLISTALNVSGFMALAILAVELLNASEAVIVVYTLPLWSALLAWPVLGERLTRLRSVALVLGLTGVAVLVGPDALGGFARRDRLAGLAVGIACSLVFALGTVLSKRRPLAMPPVASVAWQVGIGAVPLIALAFLEHPDWSRLTHRGVIGCFYLATIPLTVAYTAWFRALRLLPASTASIGSLLVPIIGVFASAAILGEPLGARQIAALGLTVGGVALAARA
jgi:drug/metabolite transporter (DMT)-like permease